MNNPNTTDDLKDLLITREIVITQDAIARGLEMVVSAQKVVETVYQQGGKSLMFHMPKEDMTFQQKHGTDSDNPICVVLQTPNGKLMSGMPNQHTFSSLSYLKWIVFPVFTSEERARKFISTMKENLFIFPKHELHLMRFDENLKKLAQEGGVVVNPLPEIFMGTFPFYNEEVKGIVFYI